jgi:hypothetical protein
MAFFRVTLKKRAVKAIQNINEPFYSSIKEAVYGLENNPGCGKQHKLQNPKSNWNKKLLFFKIPTNPFVIII